MLRVRAFLTSCRNLKLPPVGLLSWLFDRGSGAGRGVEELAARLKFGVEELRSVEPRYHEFRIAKRSGGQRRILAPAPELKSLQRRLHRRLLARLPVHPAAVGFRRGESIVTHARRHQGQAAVLRLDLRDFFPSTSTKRIEKYFRAIGWNRQAAALLVKLCTAEGGLPQGAPTSPVLSNLVNYRFDARIAAAAKLMNAVYSRYADDITLSFSDQEAGAGHNAAALCSFVRRLAAEEGYRLHRKKSSIRRRHQRQVVVGLVVNQKVQLPRETRRWLRAVEHRAREQSRSAAFPNRPSKEPTLTDSQLDGWRALQAMIERQSEQP